MAKEPLSGQEQRAQQAKQPTAQRPAERAPEKGANPLQHSAGSTTARIVEQQRPDAKRKPGIQMEPQKVMAGRAGERNVTIEQIMVPVGLDMSCWYKVKTLAGNIVEVTLEQRLYKKAFSGQGTVSTSVLPVAPVGTVLKVTVHDLTTGEVIEQTGKWRLLGGSWAKLWDLIKSLLGFS